jgi:hypothetical protein
MELMSRGQFIILLSPFPLENRKIYYMPLGKMSYTKKEETFKSYVPFFGKIL